MASIPLPALHINPPEDPLAQVGKAIQLKSLMQSQATHQQEQQMRAIEIQKAQQLQKDQQTYQQALAANNAEPEAALKSIVGKVSPQSYQSFYKSHLDTQKELSEKSAKDWDLLQKKHGALADIYQQAQNLPDEQYAQTWPQIASAANDIEPKLKLDPNQPVPKPALSQMGIGLSVTENYIKQEAEKRAVKAAADTAIKNAAELPGQQAESTTKQLSAAAQYMNGITDAGMWTQAKKSLAKRGVSPDILDRIPDQYSPEAADAVRQMGITPQQAANAPVDKAELADWLKKNPGKGPSDFMAYKAKLVPQFNFNLQNTGTTGNATEVAKRFGMSPAAFDQAAEKYMSTGQLPPSGRGGPSLALNKAIMNRGSELHPTASLAANSAEYKANTESLRKLQTQTDAVEAFENTAGKNIDRLLSNADKIPDLGVRFANVPVRMISEKMIGTEAMARFKADLLTAQNESAKVLNSANMTGVLSDSARHELQELANGNLPFKSLKAAFEEIKNDMGNRKESYQQQIDDIKGRLGGKSAPEHNAPQLPAVAAAQLQEGHETTFANGQVWTKKNGQAVQIK